MKKERRNFTGRPELRQSADGGTSRHIEGYALLFDTRSQDLGGFTEMIAPGALDGVLERSDIMALLNHDINRGVLARNRQGGGSLTLEIDDKGLRYSFDAPNTALGDEVLEGVRRGDISGSSFAFTVEEEAWERKGEEYLRTIKRFGQLFDVSPVYNPAYLDTSVEVDSRGLAEFKSSFEIRSDSDTEQKEEEETEKEGRPSEEETEEEKKSSEDEEPQSEDEGCRSEGNEEEPDEEEGRNEDPEGEESEDKRNNNAQNRPMKKKKFSLLAAVRASVNREAFDEATLEMNDLGRRALTASSLTPDGDILIPFTRNMERRFEEEPAGILASQNTEAQTYGGEAVPTELFDILGPLRDRLVVAQLGARMLSLQGNVEIPIYSGANCFWESEIGAAKDGAGKFETIKMSPKRIAAYLAISKQFLIQTDASAEALIRQDLINCVAEKLQKTMFGDGEGDNVTPAGLFKGVTADGSAFTYADAVGMEEALETANVYGDFKYVASPSAKAILRTTSMDRGSGRFLMESNEVLGVPVTSTSSVVTKGLILADWSQFYVANFGALDITVDPYTLAGNGQIRLIVNAWFDYCSVRPQAFVKRILK